MNSIELVCPHCTARLTVSPNAPQQLICPTCLARIHNPLGLPPGGTFRSLEPIEEDVQSDMSIINAGSIALIAVVAIGSVAAFWRVNRNSSADLLFVIFAVATAAMLALVALVRQKASKRPDMLEHSAVKLLVIVAKVVLGFALAFVGIGLLLFGLCAAVIMAGAHR